jgi:hypothetical protein
MTATTFNGWANFETWNVKLWIDNEQALSAYWREQARTCWGGAAADEYTTKSQRALYDLADLLKTEITASAPDLGESLFGDMLLAALGKVHWDEIADSLLAEIDGYEPREPRE